MTQYFDYIVIGGGSAGYAAARTARQFCERVAIVDGADSLGGLCILRGCMPSKTLIHTAEILHHALHARTYGLSVGEAYADMRAVMARKRRLISEFADYRASQLRDNRFTLFRQEARFVSPEMVRLSDGTDLTAPAILVATGSVIQTPPIPGLEAVPALTSDDILDLEALPETMIILGGGVVACELSQYLCRMGVSVTQIQRSPRLLKEHSTEASAVVAEVLREEGVQLYTDTRIERIEPTPQGVRVRFRHGQGSHTVEAQSLLNALGRRPATEGLALAKAGVELSHSGHIATDRNQRTSNPRVYAAGDVAGPHEIVHLAILQGEHAARHACGVASLPVNYDWVTSVVFTDPQVAFCGLPEEQLRARGVSFQHASHPFADHGKSIIMEANHGHVAVWCESASGRLLAAECVGRDAGELIHSMAVALPLQASVHDLLKAHWYHPTLSEIWTYPLEECAATITPPGTPTDPPSA